MTTTPKKPQPARKRMPTTTTKRGEVSEAVMAGLRGVPRGEMSTDEFREALRRLYGAELPVTRLCKEAAYDLESSPQRMVKYWFSERKIDGAVKVALYLLIRQLRRPPLDHSKVPIPSHGSKPHIKSRLNAKTRQK